MPKLMMASPRLGKPNHSKDIALQEIATVSKNCARLNIPPPPSLESQKKAIARFTGIKDWQSTGDVEEASRRIIECVMKQKKILDLSGLGLSPFSKDMLKHLEFLGTFICDDINSELHTLPDYFLNKDWTILFVYTQTT